MTSNSHRAAKLTTLDLYNLDRACSVIRRAFDRGPGGVYLVGTAGAFGEGDGYRDVDVRLILPDDEFAAACPTRERWEMLCVAIGTYLRETTGLPVDFQVQAMTVANEKHDKPRNPLGIGTARVFAGGGDGTPDWSAAT